MYDRVPTPGKENRVRITQDDGQIVEGVLSYADDATQEGSAYTKENVLPDDVCGILGIDPETSEPKDAWIGVITALGYSVLSIIAREVDGSPLANFKVEGLPDTLLESKMYTDENGKIFVLIPEGTYTLSIPQANCIDATLESQDVDISSGQIKTVLFQQQETDITSQTISTTQIVRFSSNVASVDVFCCGGGGGGGGGGVKTSNTSPALGGGGGAGGRTQTRLSLIPTPYQNYTATIGSGGSGGSGATEGSLDSATSGNFGGTTSFMSASASGGQGGTRGYWGVIDGYGNGGNGGSGGGGAGDSRTGGTGGTDGGDGTSGASPGGTGQGTTTRAFGESNGTLCASGGDGGNTGTAGATSSTYGGGGGGGRSRNSTSGNGYSGSSGRAGVVMIRWVNKS